MAEIGYATLGIIPSFRGFESALTRETNGPLAKVGAEGGARFGTEAGTAAGKRFGGTFSRFAKAALLGAGAAAGYGAFTLAKESVTLASDLSESLNAVNVSYGKQARAVRKLGTQAADALGLSNEEFNSLSVRFSAFSKTIAGGEGRKVVTTLDDLTTRAADFASVMNLDVNEAAQLFQSGLAGETEPLRRYGLDLSAAAVQAHALEAGIVESTRDLDEAAKVQARYSLLMKQTAQTQGDFANTSDSLANRQRILNARWDDARAKLGTALLPIIEDVTGFLVDKGIPAFEDFSDWFTSDGIDGIKRFGRFLEDDVVPPLRKGAEWAEEFIGFLNDMPKWAKVGGLAGLAGLGGFAKLRGGGLGGGGALGTAGKALGLAKAVRVFETNPAALGGGGAGAGAAGGKGKWLLTAGTVGITVAGATAVSFAATKAIIDLQNKVAPNAAKDGVAGTPRNAGFDGLFGPDGLDGAKAESKLGVIENAFYGVRDAVMGTAADVGLLGDDIKALPPATVDFKMPGFASLMGQLGQVRDEIDWIARPRQARITITQQYAAEGRQTLGGLQATTGGPGVTFTGPINVKADTFEDIVRKTRRRARAQAGGGVGGF